MAITRQSRQIQWSASATTSVTTGSTDTSDAMTFSSDAVLASISVKADNGGTPASGDTVDVKILYTNGDTDGTGGTDEYDTQEIADPIMQIDTNSVDPAQLTRPIPVGAKGIKVHVKNNGASTMTISAVLEEVNSA